MARMGRLAVIAGSGLRSSRFGSGAARVEHGGITMFDAGTHLVLERHGSNGFVRAHEVDHVSHVRALMLADCDRALGISSVGSLRLDWPVGTVVCPDDFYAPDVNPTLFDDASSHSVPGFDDAWRHRVIDTWRAHTDSQILDGGIYTQTRGPRFETPAEVRALAQVGDLVGMTIAAECILAREAGIAYAAICVVDNPANGIEPTPLSFEQYSEGVAANRSRLCSDLDAVLPALAEAPR
ncbi:MAG: MTAP family purine nucleoside phosphorylase [Actinobacteria bacterium]|nr:MTAP family purine nucleoside phosphorylase [Actinomycetota bacterium]